MNTLLNNVNAQIQALKDIQMLFKNHPMLERLETNYYLEEDDSYVNVIFDDLTINGVKYELDGEEDPGITEMDEIENNILDKEDLNGLESDLATILSDGYEKSIEYLIINRADILALGINLISKKL